MTTSTPYLPIRQLAPLEEGGTIARGGFSFQDHIAVGLCLEMITKSSLQEVWCETQDDMTLIWEDDNQEIVEFVQVKDIALDHFWSIAELCKRDKTIARGGIGSSILEKSLSHDRCKETTRFRIITSVRTKDDLNILELPLSSPDRNPQNAKLLQLCKEITDRLPGVISPNGNSLSYWAHNTLWVVETNAEAVINKNLIILSKHVSGRGWVLSPDTIESLVYSKLLDLVQEAALAKWKIDPEKKKIKKEDFVRRLESLISQAQYWGINPSGKKLREKMEKVNLPSDYILTAIEERRRYRQETLELKYLDFSDRDLIEGEIYAELQRLRARLDSGELKEGFDFYKICLDKLQELKISMHTKERPPLFFLTGCMHEITDRCGHRYHKEPV